MVVVDVVDVDVDGDTRGVDVVVDVGGDVRV
jgi:hypothetical protein